MLVGLVGFMVVGIDGYGIGVYWVGGDGVLVAMGFVAMGHRLYVFGLICVYLKKIVILS